MIEIKNLTKSYDKKCILKNINLKINDNEQVSIIGKSGCGKSTLLRCIARLEKIDKGQILIDNENINNIKKFYNKVGMVFQSFNLFENMTVLENLIIAPVKLKIQTKDEAIKLAKGYLKEINLENKINEYPKNLSGGEKTLAILSFIFALQKTPPFFILDEADAALDKDNIERLNAYIQAQDLQFIVISLKDYFFKNADSLIGIYKSNNESKILSYKFQ